MARATRRPTTHNRRIVREDSILPPSSTLVFNLRNVPRELWAGVRAQATREGLSVNAWCLKVIRCAIQDSDNHKP